MKYGMYSSKLISIYPVQISLPLRQCQNEIAEFGGLIVETKSLQNRPKPFSLVVLDKTQISQSARCVVDKT